MRRRCPSAETRVSRDVCQPKHVLVSSPAAPRSGDRAPPHKAENSDSSRLPQSRWPLIAAFAPPAIATLLVRAGLVKEAEEAAAGFPPRIAERRESGGCGLARDEAALWLVAQHRDKLGA